MVKIRLARGGKKKTPYYQVVATDSRERRDSNYKERLGFFNPLARSNEVAFKIDQERYNYWVNNGAQLSERVAALINTHGFCSADEQQAS